MSKNSEHIISVIKEIETVIEFHDFLLKKFIAENIEEVISAKSDKDATSLIDYPSFKQKCRDIVLGGLKENRSNIKKSKDVSYDDIAEVSSYIIDLGHKLWTMKVDLPSTVKVLRQKFNTGVVN